MNSDQIVHLFIFLCILYTGLSLAGIVPVPEKQLQRINRYSRKKRIMLLFACAFLLAAYAYFILHQDIK
jgi:hypothetical protein